MSVSSQTYAPAVWTVWLMLGSKLSIHEDGREHYSDDVGSLIVIRVVDFE